MSVAILEPVWASQLRILGVDDDRDVADSLAALLEILAYDVRVAYAGQYRPDFVILDLNMPRLDGLQTALRLRRDRRLMRASFIAHRASSESSVKLTTSRIGFRHFVTKGTTGSSSELIRALKGRGYSNRQSDTYVDKLLNGAKPGDLPVQHPTKFDLWINLKTAKALGLAIPQPVLLRADRVIQ